MDKHLLEEGLDFTPRFDESGLIPCITTDFETGDVLMMAYMNIDSLALTLRTREAHYWSRSRQALWHKGASSGYTQHVIEMLTDCDQDCILLKVCVNKSVHGDAEGTCHTGRKSCFYRHVENINDLKFT